MSSYKWGVAIAGTAVLVGLYVISRQNYLLFHTLAEGFSIAVACSIFMVTWNSRRYIENNYVLFLGIAFLFVGGMDMVHTLSYEGIDIFGDKSANLPTQLWIATRYLHAVTLLIAPLFIGRKVRVEYILSGYAVATALLLLSIFEWKNFPVCFVEGQGLTPFKIASEYVISLILIASAYVLYLKRDAFEKKVLNLLYGAIFATVAAELAFTLYISAHGFSNLVGHYMKIVAFYLIYKAVIETGLREPYSLMFRNVKESEDRFRSFSEATFEGIVISHEGRILDTNKQAAEMFGYESPSDMVGNNIFELAGTESREIVRNAIRQESVELYEAAFLRKGGSKFDAEVRGRTFEYYGHRVRVKAIRDITERKRAEEALRESEERMNRAQEIAHLGSWELDLTNNRLTWSDEVYRIFGLQPQEFGATYEAFMEAVHPDDRAAVDAAYSGSLRENMDNYEIEHRIVRKSSREVRFVHEKCEHIRDGSGRIIRSVGMVHDITERKRAIAEIERLASFPELNPNPVLEVDETGNIHYLNPAAKALFGTKQPAKHMFLEGIHALLEGLGDEDVISREVKVGDYWYDQVFNRVPGSDRIRIYARNITEQKRTEEALRKALEKSTRREEEVEALLKGSRAVLEYRDFERPARAIFDACKDLIGAEAGYVALLSKDGSKNEVLFLDAGGLPCTVDPLLPMPIRGLRAEAYRSGKVVYENDFTNSEWIRLMPEGHVELKNVLFAPLMIESKVMGLMGIANKEGDFTQDDVRLAAAFGELAAVALQNSRALESLEESEERFRSVSQSASDAIISSDQSGNVVFWNNAAERIFGYGAEEAIGKPLTMIMPEALRQDHKNAMANAVSTGDLRMAGKTVELTGLRKDGTEFPVELSLSRWKTGEEVFFSAIVRDVTARKQSEEELEKYRAHLEEVVRERTKELLSAYEELEREMIERAKAESQLRQSQKMEAVGQLAGGIAHDFNNRLFAIRNYAHILKSSVMDDSAHEMIEKLIVSCDKAAQLVDDLLKFSREKAINPKPIDVNVIVREARSILEIAVGSSIDLTINFSPEPLQVMADSSNMELVLLNLVNNARDVMPEGGSIAISTGRVEAEEVPVDALNGGKWFPCAVISVSDTGPGLQEGMEDKIFEPFFTTKEIGKGTGLGLSIVYGVVKQHGGFVDVASERGKGTTFRIFLPLMT